MKYKNSIFPLRGLGCFLFTLLLTACVNMDDATVPVTAKIQVQQPTTVPEGSPSGIAPAPIFPPSQREGAGVGLPVTLLSTNGESRQALTDAEGIATFENVTPDVYDISTSWTITPQQYAEMTGSNEVVSSATVSGSLNSHLLTGADIVNLPTNVSADRDIVISKVYYAASKDNNNRTYMAGKYIELYNQSNNTIDISGLYIGMTEAESTMAYTLDNLHTAFADSVILLKQIYRIPVDLPKKEGRGCALLPPGGTVVICNSAIDHTTNDSLEHNLTDADFEVKDVKGSFQNNPATTAMEMIYQIYNGTSVMNLLQSGPTGVVIFRTDDDVTSWQKVYAYGKTSGMQWTLCPIRHIIDGMEALSNKSSGIDIKTKRLYSSIDAGYTYINAASGWTGETVYRKTLRLAPDGHKILMDTNNSSNDFKVSKDIQPREYDDVEF